MNCPKCGSTDCTKDGIVKGKRHHKCKPCGYRHAVQQRGIGAATKREALQLYLESLGFRPIGRILKCSHVAVHNWVRAHGESVEAIRSAAGVGVVEMDEMRTYIGSKKTTAGSGLPLAEMGGGPSTAKWLLPATPARAGSSGTQSKTTT
jgi:transposase-like protein